jgi:NADH-quinone oxidoreductase subunit M
MSLVTSGVLPNSGGPSLSVLIWLPLVIGLIASAVPARWSGRLSAVLSLAPLALAIDFLVRFKGSFGGLQFVTDHVWISALGIHYKLALTGLNVTLVLLTTVLFSVSLFWSAARTVERPQFYYLMFGLAESAVLGAFVAQDVMLFVGFFDLMLIPFYFITGVWGGGPERRRATFMLVIYTAIGSFLMLAAAIATGVLASHGGSTNFTFSSLAAHPLSKSSQEWIFLCFAAAFLIKSPIAPFHGWLATVYKAMPIPAVAVFSGALSKVAAYGFLAIVLPLFPQAAAHFQGAMLVIGVVSLLWSTALAFTTRDARLVIAYSSVAQMSFITLGIFSLHTEGAQGSLLQMVNHGIVTSASFFVLAALAARAGGSEMLDDMGGIAFRAPVLATMFLVVAMATLAMPGTANFVGEFMILLGVFKQNLPLAFIGSIGMIGAAVYALRLFISSMHNRVRGGVRSFELGWGEALGIVPLVALILVLAFFPQFGLERSQPAVKSAISHARSGQLTATRIVHSGQQTIAQVVLPKP